MSHLEPHTLAADEKPATQCYVEVPSPVQEFAYGGDDKLPPPPTLTPEEEKRLWRKIDMRFMPIVTLLYLFSFLDRANIGEFRLPFALVILLIVHT